MADGLSPDRRTAGKYHDPTDGCANDCLYHLLQKYNHVTHEQSGIVRAIAFPEIYPRNMQVGIFLTRDVHIWTTTTFCAMKKTNYELLLKQPAALWTMKNIQKLLVELQNKGVSMVIISQQNWSKTSSLRKHQAKMCFTFFMFYKNRHSVI